MMMVAMAATISVVFTTCSKDENKPEEINSDIIKDKLFFDNLEATTSSDFIVFNRDGTYYYDIRTEYFTGDYKIFESQKSMGILSYIWMGNELEAEYEYTLFKMNVIGNNNFEQLWVYHLGDGGIIVYFYSKNEVMQKLMFRRVGFS